MTGKADKGSKLNEGYRKIFNAYKEITEQLARLSSPTNAGLALRVTKICSKMFFNLYSNAPTFQLTLFSNLWTIKYIHICKFSHIYVHAYVSRIICFNTYKRKGGILWLRFSIPCD